MRSRPGSSLGSIAASLCDGLGSFRAVAFAAGGSTEAAGSVDNAVGFSGKGVTRRTEPSSFTASVSSRTSFFSSGTGRTGSLGRLSSVMMRLIEAIISSIEGSGGDLAMSGIKATDKDSGTILT
jgi:hypothetical protein